MRRLTDHKLNEANLALKISAMDEPGAGGANHRYDITGFDAKENPAANPIGGYRLGNEVRCQIVFQNGPIQEVGVNGVTQEALLAIVIDRLRSFQAGPYSCKENAVALTHIETALLWLKSRTLERMARGVEGTSEK